MGLEVTEDHNDVPMSMTHIAAEYEGVDGNANKFEKKEGVELFKGGNNAPLPLVQIPAKIVQTDTKSIKQGRTFMPREDSGAMVHDVDRIESPAALVN